MAAIEVVGRKGNDNQFEVTLRGDVQSVVQVLTSGLSLDSLQQIAEAIEKQLEEAKSAGAVDPVGEDSNAGPRA